MVTNVRGGDARSAYAESATLVRAAQDGDESAFGRLYDRWFDGVFDVALRITRDRDDAAAITQDTFLAAWRKLDTIADPQAFGAWLLQIARNRSLTHIAKMRRSTPTDAETMAMIEAAGGSTGTGPDGFCVDDRTGGVPEPERAVTDAEVSALVWDAAEALGERDATVLDLHLRHGYTPGEIAASIGVTRNNANQLLHRLRKRLETSVRARTLWRSGDPACVVLAAELASAGIARFDARAVDIIQHHIESCEDCRERQRARVAPAALFAATPIVVAPFALRVATAQALDVAGVPMEGSETSAEPAGTTEFVDTDWDDTDDADSDFGLGVRAEPEDEMDLVIDGENHVDSELDDWADDDLPESPAAPDWADDDLPESPAAPDWADDDLPESPAAPDAGVPVDIDQGAQEIPEI